MSATTSLPPPFAELLKKATPGPGFWPDARCHILAPNGLVLADFHACSDELEGEPAKDRLQADRDLVLRLLSWAHAGGVEELRSLRDILAAEANKSNELSVYFARRLWELRASLALLDGQKIL